MRICFGIIALASLSFAADPLVWQAGGAKLTISRSPLRIGIDGAAQAHPDGGLLLGDADHPEVASVTAESLDRHGDKVLDVTTAGGKSARVTVTFTPNQADFVVRPLHPMAVSV